MTHRSFQELMTDAIDGRLSAEDVVRFDALLEESSEHQREWVAFQEMRERLLAVGPEAPPPGLAARIRASIHEERARDGAASSPSPGPVDDPSLEPSRWSHLHRMGWLRAAAVFVLLALATPIVLQTWKARRPSITEPATTMEAEAERLYKSEELEDDIEVSEEMAPGSSARRSQLKAPPPGADSAARERAAGEELRLKGLTPPPASEADKEKGEAEPLLSKYADLMENRLRQLESGQPGEPVPVVEEAMLYFGRSMAQFSKEELQSRGVSSLRRALDEELSGGRGRTLYVGSPSEQSRSRDAQGADGASGRAGGEKKLAEVQGRGRPPVEKPKAAPIGGGGSARPPQGVVGGSVPSSPSGKDRGVPERQFLTVMGKGVGTRMGRLFEHWPGARLSLQGGLSTPAGDKSDRSPPITSVGRDEKPAAGLKPKAQGAAGYSIFEVTLPIAHADAFVRSLAQESSLSLRFIGPSRPAVAEPGSGRLPELQTKVSIEQVIQNAASSRGVGEQRTLVLIVLDR